MTDTLSAKRDTQRILDYVEGLAKESRKALMAEFIQKHKGIPFKATPQLLRDSLLAWYTRRDNNLKLTSEGTNSGSMGEVRTSFKGVYKMANFKLLVHAKFTVTGSSVESPAYLKELNITIAT